MRMLEYHGQVEVTRGDADSYRNALFTFLADTFSTWQGKSAIRAADYGETLSMLLRDITDGKSEAEAVKVYDDGKLEVHFRIEDWPYDGLHFHVAEFRDVWWMKKPYESPTAEVTEDV